MTLLIAAVAFYPQEPPKFPKPEEWKIAGCELGITSGTVVARLGAPTDKSGSLATDEKSDAYWKELQIRAQFEKGRLVEISASKKHEKTNIPDVGSLSEALTVFGSLSEEYEPEDKTSKIVWFEKNLVSYHIRDQKISTVTLSYIDKRMKALSDEIDRLIEERKKQPDYNLELVESSCSISYDKKDANNIFYCETNGIVMNRRDTMVNIRVRVKYFMKGDKFVKADETTLYRVKPGEERIFEITTYDVIGNAKTNTYLVELAVVED